MSERRLQAGLRLVVEELAPFVLLALVIGFFYVLVGPEFVGARNLRTVSVQSVVVLVAAMGMTAVIISGGIDLSVGSTLSLVTVVVAVLARELLGAGWAPGLAFAVAIVAAIGVAIVCGLINGFAITVLRVSPFVTTLGTMWVFRGFALWLAGSKTVETGSDRLRFLMDTRPPEGAEWLLVSPGVWVAVIALVMTFVLLRFTVPGRYVYAIGSSEAAARLCGVRVGLQKLWIYGFAGLMAGIAGVLLYSYQNLGDPTTASGKELYVIAAAVIGGASLSGGRGSAIGAAVGALFVQFLEQGLVLKDVDQSFRLMVVGGFLVFAVALDQYRAARWGGLRS